MHNCQHPNRLIDLVCASLFFSCSASLSWADDFCNAVLARDLSSKSELKQNSNSTNAKKHAQCITSSSSASGQSEKKGGLKIGPGEAKKDQSNSSNQNQSSSDCETNSADEHASAALYYAQSAHSEVVQAWKECMANRQQFTCWAERKGSDERLTFHATWTKRSKQPRIINSTIRIGSRPEKRAFTDRRRLYLEDNLFNADRRKNEAVVFTVEATADDTVADTCVAYVPAIAIDQVPPTVNALFRSSSDIARMPPPSECSCVSTSMPEHPKLFEKFAPGSKAVLTNNCAREVAVFMYQDTVPSSMGVPAPQPANGRTFAYSKVLPKQQLVADLSGVVGHSRIVTDCPRGATRQAIAVAPAAAPVICFSDARVTSTSRSSTPRFCKGSGPPGTPCVCKEGAAQYDGVNWSGPLPFGP